MVPQATVCTNAQCPPTRRKSAAETAETANRLKIRWVRNMISD